MSPADAVRVRDMIDAIEAARRFAAGRDRSHVDTDQMLLFALVRAVERARPLGTRTALPPCVRQAHPPYAAGVSAQGPPS